MGGARMSYEVVAGAKASGQIYLIPTL